MKQPLDDRSRTNSTARAPSPVPRRKHKSGMDLHVESHLRGMRGSWQRTSRLGSTHLEKLHTVLLLRCFFDAARLALKMVNVVRERGSTPEGELKRLTPALIAMQLEAPVRVHGGALHGVDLLPLPQISALAKGEPEDQIDRFYGHLTTAVDLSLSRNQSGSRKQPRNVDARALEIVYRCLLMMDVQLDERHLRRLLSTVDPVGPIRTTFSRKRLDAVRRIRSARPRLNRLSPDTELFAFLSVVADGGEDPFRIDFLSKFNS